MKASSIAVATFGIFLIVGCTTTPTKKYGQLESTTDESKLNVSFGAESTDYQRTVSNINHSAIGWIEEGTWRARGDAGVAVVKIYLATLFDGRAYKKKSVWELQSLAVRFSGNAILDFGAQGVVKTNSGPIEYVFYRQSGRPCVFIRKYWSDPEMQGDINVYTGYSWVAGTSLIYASDCRPGGDDLQLEDLNPLLIGIKARNLYWPDSMFVSVDGTLGGGSVDSSDGPGSDVDITGTYASDITSNASDIFPNEYRKIVITLIQDGKSVIGQDSSGEFKISGTRNGNTISFLTGEMNYRKCKCNHIKGSWRIDGDGNGLEGTWDRGAGYKGKWNLTRIE